jgi:hypothetical protein
MIDVNLREQTEALLKTLTPREERVIKMRFGIGEGNEHTLEEVGQNFAVTRERIRQIEAKALRKLRTRPARRSGVPRGSIVSAGGRSSLRLPCPAPSPQFASPGVTNERKRLCPEGRFSGPLQKSGSLRCPDQFRCGGDWNRATLLNSVTCVTQCGRSENRIDQCPPDSCCQG